MDTKEKLNELAEMRAQVDLIALEKKKLIDGLIPPEILQQIADVETEFAPKFESMQKSISAVEEAIKQETIALGTTIHGDLLDAVFASGRESWETKGLDGYMVAHPEIAQFKKKGNPYVTIRARK